MAFSTRTGIFNMPDVGHTISVYDAGTQNLTPNIIDRDGNLITNPFTVPDSPSWGFDTSDFRKIDLYYDKNDGQGNRLILNNFIVKSVYSYNELSDKPTLGTASSLDAGNGPNQLLQLDESGQLPVSEIDLETADNYKVSGQPLLISERVGPLAPVQSVGGLTGNVNITWAMLGVYIGTVEPTLKTYAEWAATRTGYWSWIDISGETGTSNISVVSSGGIVLGGTAPIQRAAKDVGSGGMVIGGTAIISSSVAGAPQSVAVVSSGGLVIGGSAIVTSSVGTQSVSVLATGGLVIGGSAVIDSSVAGGGGGTELTIYGDAADTSAVFTTPSPANWAAMTSATSVAPGPNNTLTNIMVASYIFDEEEEMDYAVLSRGYLYFPIPAGVTVTSATLYLTSTNVGAGVISGTRLSVQQGSQSKPAVAGDFDGMVGNTFGYTDAFTATGQERSITFNAGGLSYLTSVAGGEALLMLREYDHDYLNVSPYQGEKRADFFTQDSGGINRPRLVITYTE